MEAPLVLVSISDDRTSLALQAALLARAPALRVERCAPSLLVERCTTARVDLLVMSSDVDPTAGAALLREVAAFTVTPQAVVVFDDATDERRTAVARVGAWEHVLSRHGDAAGLGPLLALCDHVLAWDARDARLYAASKQLRALVEHSTDGIYIIRDGVLVYTNRRFQEMVGFSDEEIASPSFTLGMITAPESRDFIDRRRQMVSAGIQVEPRYEFVALRKDRSTFVAQVSVSYIEYDGKPGALGILQDITERKSFEAQLIRKNRELALLNALSGSVNEALELDATLMQGIKHMCEIVGAEGGGIALLLPDQQVLELRVAVGLADPIVHALTDVGLHTGSLLARTVRSGEIHVVDNIAEDPRIAIEAIRDTAYSGALVVPLKSRARSPGVAHVVGVAFALTAHGRRTEEVDHDLLASIGNLLGNAVDKAGLLAAEKRAVQKLVALDELALTLASTLDPSEVTLSVARSIHRLFGAAHVKIARLEGVDRNAADAWNGTQGYFVPIHTLRDGLSEDERNAIPASASIMGLCVRERRPVQRVRPRHDGVDSIDPFDGKLVAVLPHEAAMFADGVGTGVAVPVYIDGQPAGAIWLGYTSTTPLAETDLQVLSAIGVHVAIATKNAALFEARNRALEDLTTAQTQLVQAEKLNAIGLIAHGVAHDFNNVLGSILGRAQLLKAQLSDPSVRKHAEIIEQAAHDGAETVRRIQSIGRQESDDDFVPVDGSQIIEDVMEQTRPRWSKNGVSVMTRGDAGIVVAGKASELREVLVNLVHNAADAMPRGGHITLSTDAVDGRCLITVRDTGSGIPPDILSRIFDPYFTTKGDKGTGLGLSVSQSIIRRHHGELRVTSQTSGPERGTAFVIDLPLLHGQSTSARTSTRRRNATRPADKARILVVDDEENIREILAEMLLTDDHEVVTAADGSSALARLHGDGDFDVVFTDLGLPDMSGYEVARGVRQMYEDMPVGLVTGWGATLDPDKARAHGVTMVISKPFRLDQVLALVEEALIRRHPDDAID